MPRLRKCVVLASVLLLGSADPTSAAPPIAQSVRDDWCFRESLSAIRDWEAILARLEAVAPRWKSAPVLPVPAEGGAVAWPNPVPRVLMPPGDRGLALEVRLAGGKVEIQRRGPGGKKEQESAAPGQTVQGYQHPGGGGKDQWYHAYHRRFDRLTAFQARSAPFALKLDGPDLVRGPNHLAVAIRNTGGRPLALTAALEFHGPKQSRSCGRETIELRPGEDRSLRFPVWLDAPGGGLLVLDIEAGGQSFWLPLLTHVEDVPAILAGIRQILADAPDAAAGVRLAAVERRAAQLTADAPSAGPAWRGLFDEASALRDELLLARIDFGAILFLKRKPFFSEQPFMDAHHLLNRPGGGIYRLSPVRPDGKVEPVVDRLGEGVYRDVCLHWDARRMLFAFGNGSDAWDGRQSYHLYESDVEGRTVRQVTKGPKNDCEPFYLPDGRIGFTSDRSEHFVMCGGDRHSPTLFAAAADGSQIEQLSHNVFNDFNPCVLPDGRILYSRWEYNERSVTSMHNPFTANPDGTMVAPYYGNATFRPNVVMFPRPVPGSTQIMALFTAHHGQTHGSIGLIDRRRGVDGQEPLTLLTSGVPVTAERALDSQHGWYSDPVPLSETTYLCSFTPTVVPWHEGTWALYVGDRHGNLALVYRDPAISCAEPVPLIARPRPHVIPPAAWTQEDRQGKQPEATLLVADVYAGLTGVARGTAWWLRVLEDVPRKGVHTGGVVLNAGTSIYTIKRVLGTVPVEADGSAHFVVPADRNVYFEVLDRDRREIQRMRSVVCLRPGEVRGCIGCHERRSTAPPAVAAAAARRPASRPAPPPWGTQIVSFLRDVQPVLNARCVECHAFDRAACGVILTDDLTNSFTVSYEELLPYLSTANAMRWDHPDDVYPRPPYTYGSKVSRLAQLLDAGHHGVKLTGEEQERLFTWIDTNGVYYDRYETNASGSERHIFAGPQAAVLGEVFDRRCATCHGRGDGRQDSWWLSINRRDPAASRMLAAPLARPAGGWQRCGEPVFANTGDADYKKLLAGLVAMGDLLAKDPRADLLSIRGTEAEKQMVKLPVPPPVRPAEAPGPPGGDWVALSDLEWESAAAGWSANGDKLPRRDRDATDAPLRLGRQRYRKGIGTHAPSEIVYRLDGKYQRLVATIGGAEAPGTVVFEVYADGKQIFTSGLVHGLREVKTVDVPLSGVRQLRLVVTDAGDGYIADMANWAGARLLRAGPAKP
jgi:hypothetical protein